MQLSDRPQHSPALTYEKVDEEAIMINLNTGSYYSLNDTGAMFWELMDGQRTIADCAQLIAQDYDVEADVVGADLLELAKEFASEGLIVV